MGSSASQYFELPKFFLFSEFGIFSGSVSSLDLNYKVIPKKDDDSKTLNLYIWNGKMCLDKTEESEHTSYPLTQEGYDEMLAHLEAEYLKRINN